MKLTEKSAEVFNCVKENGGKVSTDEIVEATGRNARSISANITDLAKKGLVVREKTKVEDKDVTYVVITNEGLEFVPSDEDED